MAGKLIEIKGLGDAVKAAKQGIANVRAETAGLHEDAAALTASLQDVRQQIQQAQSDIEFEATSLGNGSPTPSPQPSPPPVTPSSAPSAPAVAPTTTFPDSLTPGPGGV